LAEGRSTFKVRSLATGIPGLDEVFGGGLPEYSFNIIAGGPGAGKTTLALQFLFANVSPECPAIYFTVLGEPTLKLLRHQQQFPYFDASRIGRDLQFVHLGAELESGDLEAVMKRIVSEVARVKPRFVVVDSFRAMARAAIASGEPHIEQFVQRLAVHLATWEVTSFLIGEHGDSEANNPVFTVADGILWLSQAVDRNSVVRKLQVVKVRGQASMPGLHTFRITEHGLQVFPRMCQAPLDSTPRVSGERLSTGIAGLDEMTEGGIPAGDVVLVAGPTGSGKTTFALQFALEGLRRGESVVVAGFEEYPRE
jgi:circadian clock protein KaiC